MTERDEYQWWGSALFVAVRAIARTRELDAARWRKQNEQMGAIVTQARYLHLLRGEWPTSISPPYDEYVCEYVRVPVYPKVTGLFAESPVMTAKIEIRDVRVGMVRNSDGFWAAEFAGSREPVMFWPAPMEAPRWWDAR